VPAGIIHVIRKIVVDISSVGVNNARVGSSSRCRIKRFRIFGSTLSSLVLAAILVGCAGPPAAPAATPTVTTTPIPPPVPDPGVRPTPLELDITLGQSVYLPGEPARIRLYFRNDTEETLELSQFPPTVLVYRRRGEIGVWQSEAGGEKRVLSPGESLTHEVIWDQRQVKGAFVEPGYYDIKTQVSYSGRTEAGIRSAYARLLIQHSLGAIDRALDIDQTQTVDGVVITLKRLELSTTGAKVYALAQPPDWSPPAPVSSPAVPTPMPPPPSHMYPVPAHYSLDGGPMRDAGNAGFSWLEGGIGLIWDLIDPVPNGTEEMTFVINQFGQWPGAWEFDVDLL
jgi:hypothetical protein